MCFKKFQLQQSELRMEPLLWRPSRISKEKLKFSETSRNIIH
jgi:hypothetical protein